MISISNHSNMGLRPHFDFWQTSRFQLSLKKPLVMGILNVTPDSFSGINNVSNPVQAIDLASQHLKNGADILDIGGESTRPGAKALTADQEWDRIHPVLHELINWNKPLSVDTYHPENMQKALDMGVDIINDIWALRVGNALERVAKYDCGVCLMHMHGEPETMQLSPMLGDVVNMIASFLQIRITKANNAGIDHSRIALDPGIGFGKTTNQNFYLLKQQDAFVRMGLPVLVGWSRKSSLGIATGLAAHDRLVPSIAAALLAIERGARIVRVHDVAATVTALKVWMASENASSSEENLEECA